MDNHIALDPKHSVVVEACAGSGKTWLLVSRIVRLLLDGAQPSQILAITFTRKASQEMQARLQLWLRELAMGDDAAVGKFFAERGLESLSDAQIQRARSLYSDVLLAQPGITISTFHGWFMQVIQRAPLNADVIQGMSLLERAGSVQEEAWEELLEQMRKQPESAEAQHMQWLFGECGLYNTRKLLFNFLAKRAEWWAYTSRLPSPAGGITSDLAALPPSRMASSSIRGAGGEGAVACALDNLRADLAVDMDIDAAEDWGMCGNSEETFFAFVHQLAGNGTDVQKNMASELEQSWTEAVPEARFEKMWPLLFTQKYEPRTGSPFKPTSKQDADVFLQTRDALQTSLQTARDARTEQQAYRLNEAVLHCGVALLERYQALKQQKQQMDFPDLEWQLCRLLQRSEHAETMQYKLDSRYRHVLLDEFQDTNPLQWQILRAWFDAAVAVESQPTVFVVGDPKQSIYRFRRADARLFGVARDYLREHFAAHELHNNHTRRNAPAVLDAVNAMFADHPEGFVDFEPHTAEHTDLRGHVKVLPLVMPAIPSPPPEGEGVNLRDPLTTPRAEAEEGARHNEAVQFAELLQVIVSDWSVNEDGKERRATYADIMALVRSRTHLQVYEEALRARHIPFISSRRGGLLDTLEAEDVQALLMFLITPFADLALAQVLRTPIFSCSDKDLMLIAGSEGLKDSVRPELVEGQFINNSSDHGSTSSPRTEELRQKSSWWQRLQHLAEPSPALQRAAELLKNWLALADKLPVHDLLDRIYFEGDVLARYTAVLPPEMRAKVAANLHAFMEIALSVDAGRYPSLPRFLQELRELRDSPDDAPDEGRLGTAGNAVRIYTVHESKGLEAPIVWLLDANAEKKNKEGNDVLLDWPTHEPQPLHFSLYADQASRGKKRAPLFEQDAAQQVREEMNLLYVAMTRAQQALIVSGNSKCEDKEANKKAPSWYDRIAAVVGDQPNPLLLASPLPCAGEEQGRWVGANKAELPAILPIGKRAARNTTQQQCGIWLHALLQHLTECSPLPIPSPQSSDEATSHSTRPSRNDGQVAGYPASGRGSEREMQSSIPAGEGPGERGRELQQRLAIPSDEIDSLWQRAQHLLASPQLARFFDPRQYVSACNEMPYVNSRGELKRIDRLVEFDNDVWVLDYKLGDSEDAARYRAQMQEYRSAMQAAYAGKTVRCALLFADGVLSEV